MMIRALLRKQLRELGAAFLRSSKTGKARSRASAVGYALLFAVLVVVLMLCFAGMALPLASVLLPAGLDWLYFASMGLTALLVSVLASAFTSYSGLFQSRDNELLLSLPIPPAVIFGVRVSTVYLACLIYLLMAWVPAVVCYGLLAAHPLAGVLCSIPMALVLAGAACILAVLLGWAVALANDRARHKSLVTVVCSLVFFALYYAGFLRVQEMLDDLLADAAQSGAALACAAWPLRLLGGAAVIVLLEWNNPGTIGGLTAGGKVLASLFQSVTLRTAGFASFDQNALRDVTKAVCDVLMFVGGSSGSTAGGVKTVTVGVLVLAAVGTARGRTHITAFKRTIPQSAVANAGAIALLVLTLGFLGAGAITVLDGVSFENAIYETISALCTVGLTTGITSGLGLASCLILIIFMFFGRVGIMTISVGFMMANPAEDRITYAQTRVMIG